MNGLLQSRKFWIAVVTFLVDVTAVVVAKFFPEWAEFVAQIVGPMTALAMAVIAGIAIEDAGQKMAGPQE